MAITMATKIHEKSNKRLDVIIAKIIKYRDSMREAFADYCKAAVEEGFTANEAWTYIHTRLKDVVPRATLYRWAEKELPLEAKKSTKPRNKKIPKWESSEGEQSLSQKQTTNAHPDYVPPPEEAIHWKHPTEIHFMIKEDIDNKYDEATCKEVLKEALHKYLDLFGLYHRMKISKKSYDQKYNELQELKYKYKVCIQCNEKGVHNQGERYGWLCKKHKAENDRLNAEAGPMLGAIFAVAAAEEAKQQKKSRT
jgi:hypothetical protein